MATTNTVLFVIASVDYQPIEYSVPKKLLEQAGFKVITASDQEGTAVANDGTSTEVDMLVGNASISDYDGIFFVGGPGSLEHLDNDISYKLITAMVQARRPVGAICAATRILAHAGILRGKRATGWNGDNALPGIYKELEVQYDPKDVVIDDHIITATGPNAAREYGEQIIALLQE
ncbi:MAG TPA: DJ-1/PfpI family protein [Candidatus Limnocylindria bacterium]|nr:DJ-1/PfpI family protein [Candidatus Limnocylindria bacterium]